MSDKKPYARKHLGLLIRKEPIMLNACGEPRLNPKNQRNMLQFAVLNTVSFGTGCCPHCLIIARKMN